MGINPYRKYNHNVPIPNGRYRMLFHHLKSYKKYFNIPMYFHRYPEYGTFSSASQVQLDVSYDDLIITLNVFSKLEPIKALIFSNSVLTDEHEEVLCYRDLFWENSTHGVNSHNVGMYNTEFTDVNEVLSYISTTGIYCVERGDKYINFPPIKITDYLNYQIVKGEYFDGCKYKEIMVKPSADDIKYLRTFKFEDLTFRGTVEFRSVCCQPVKDIMTVAAFHVGAKNKLLELNSLLKEDKFLYNNGYTPTELRKLLINTDIPDFIDREGVYLLAERVINIVSDGLKERGLGEEIFIKPLFDRIKKRTNPARTMIELKHSGITMEEIIKKYAEL